MRRRARGNRTGSRLPVYSAKAMKAFIVAATALAVFPRMAWAHHFMDGGLPQTFAQGLLSGLGHPVIGLDHAAFIVAAGGGPTDAKLSAGVLWAITFCMGYIILGTPIVRHMHTSPSPD